VSGAQGLDHRFGRHASIAPGRDQRDVEAATAQHGERLEHGVVLDLRADDVPLSDGNPVIGQSQDRQIIALGGPAREDDFVALGRDHAGRFGRGRHGRAALARRPNSWGLPALPHSSEKQRLTLSLDARVDRSRRVAVEVDGHGKVRFETHPRARPTAARVYTTG